MMEWYEELASSHPNLVRLVPSIGKTHYQRDIPALHITHKPSLDAASLRPKIYLQCLMHASELGEIDDVYIDGFMLLSCL